MDKKIKMKQKAKTSPLYVILFISLLIYSSVLLILLLWTFFSSLKPAGGNYFDKNVLGLPKGHIWEWAWGNFLIAFQKFKVSVNFHGTMGYVNMLGMLINTLKYAGVNALLLATVPFFTAYVVVRFPIKLSKVLHNLVFIVMMVPVVGSAPAMLNVMDTLGVYNTWLGVWMQNFNFCGMYFLVYIAMLQGTSKELWDAAEVDGAGNWRTMLSIIMPTMLNTMGLVFMLQFIGLWNDYQSALMFLPAYPTLSVGIYKLTLDSDTVLSTVPVRLATYTVFIMPILVIFLIFRKKLMGNISIGGVKE